MVGRSSRVGVLVLVAVLFALMWAVAAVRGDEGRDAFVADWAAQRVVVVSSFEAALESPDQATLGTLMAAIEQSYVVFDEAVVSSCWRNAWATARTSLVFWRLAVFALEDGDPAMARALADVALFLDAVSESEVTC